ncbi:MAG: chemotaxis protein CheB [Endozoicomonas sp.]
MVVGASAGGLEALKVLFQRLGKNFPFAVLVTKHLGVEDEDGVLNVLDQEAEARVRLARDKQSIHPGEIYLAPGDYHLQVEDRGSMSLSADERVCHSRPSIDVLFQTAADVYGAEVIAVLLTGANRDGADGIVAVRNRGGMTIVQNPESSEVPVMPNAAVATGCVGHILELEQIAGFLRQSTDSD